MPTTDTVSLSASLLLKTSALQPRSLIAGRSSSTHHSSMDLLSSCVVDSTKDASGKETLTYFVQTMNGRKISVAVLTQADEGEYDCHASEDWKQFLRATGYFRLMAKEFRSREEIEHKLGHYVLQIASMPTITACPRSVSVHFPDVLQFTVVWFLLKPTDLEFAQIPQCMHRHLFEHARLYARFVYGCSSWLVKVDDFCFTSGFAEFLIENDVAPGTYLLLRHIGDFTFEVLMFDNLGFSLNLAGTLSGSVNTQNRLGLFHVYVESCLPDCTYRQLYCPPSFLYVHKETPKKFCEAFLCSCTDMRGRLLICYGKKARYSMLGPKPMLRDIQETFQLSRRTTLAFIKHGRGGALLMAISKCGLEAPPKRAETYDICTTACNN